MAGEIASFGLTQKGMIQALGVNQGTLAGPLQRLVLSGALGVSREHARGADRRVKVYRLTPLGEKLVEELRRRNRVVDPFARKTRESELPSDRAPSDAPGTPEALPAAPARRSQSVRRTAGNDPERGPNG